MKLESQQIISDLSSQVKTLIHLGSKMQSETNKLLNTYPADGGWNILECFEHLNRYSQFYIPEFQKTIGSAKPKQSNYYKTGFLGNYSAVQMLPKDGVIANKMNTFKSKDPSLSATPVGADVIDQFLSDQNQILDVLEKAKKVDLGKNKVKTTLPLIKFKLGDALRFFLNHELRHKVQIERVYREVK